MTAWMPSIISAPEAPRQKSGLFFRVFIWALFIGLVLLIQIVSFVANVGADATLAKAQAEVQVIASAVDKYQEHLGYTAGHASEVANEVTDRRDRAHAEC